MFQSSKRRAALALGLILALGCPAVAAAHGGGLDAYGCHKATKHGGYHCHRGPYAGNAFASKSAMPDQIVGQAAAATKNYGQLRSWRVSGATTNYAFIERSISIIAWPFLQPR